MIVQFEVENFRSIREAQTLSFAPAAEDRLKGRLLVDEKRPKDTLLPSIFLYGGNASGKTNICRALEALRWLTIFSAPRLTRGEQIPHIEPFRLDPITVTSPSRFGITLLLNGDFWEYHVVCDAERVHEESLKRKANTPQGRWAWVFQRAGAERNLWKGGAPRLNATLFESVRDNATVLSKAAADQVPAVAAVFDAISAIEFRRLGLSPGDVVNQAADSCNVDPALKIWLAQIVARADIQVDSIDLVNREITPDELPEDIRDKVLANRPEGEAKLFHRRLSFQRLDTSGQTVEFSIREESDGTIRFLALSLSIYAALKNGNLLVMDEFDASLHPLLAREMRDVMNDPDLNRYGAQFVVVTHNDALLDSSRLRRDQIVLVSRGKSRGTQWHAMADLDSMPRPDESYARRYLNGGYGGVPHLGDLREIFLDLIRDKTTVKEPLNKEAVPSRKKSRRVESIGT